MASLDLAGLRTIVVTGGAGFIGSHVVDDLLRACPAAEIRVLDAFTYAADMANLDGAMRIGRVTLRQGDVGITDFGFDGDRAAARCCQHHHTHDAFCIDLAAVAFEPDIRSKAAGKLGELGRGPCVQAKFIDDGGFSAGHRGVSLASRLGA